MYIADKIKDFNEANNADKVLSESFGRQAKSRFAYFAYWFRIGLVLFWLVSCLLLTGCGAKNTGDWKIGKSLDPQIVESYVNKDSSNFRFYEKEVGKSLRLLLFDDNKLCGAKGCLLLAANSEGDVVLSSYVSVFTPVEQSVVAVDRNIPLNMDSSLPCLVLSQGNNGSPHRYCFNGTSYIEF